MILKTASWFSVLPPDHIRIGISRGVPRLAIGKGYRLYRKLAPGPWFNHVPLDEYRRRYDAEILAPWIRNRWSTTSCASPAAASRCSAASNAQGPANGATAPSSPNGSTASSASTSPNWATRARPCIRCGRRKC